MSAFKEQVGGNHYTKMAIQPAEYCFKNNIGKLEGDAIAYLSRWKDKNGLEDLKKARHTIDLLIELEVSKRNEAVNLQGNDLKVSICDSMNLADSFLSDAAKGLMSWGAEMGMKWKECDSLTDIRATELAYAENQHKTLWTEADEERMRVVLSNGNDGEVYKQDDDWVEWKGGECPVCGFQWVDVQVRSGDTYSGRAEVFVWGWNADEADIVAYRNIPRKCA